MWNYEVERNGDEVDSLLDKCAEQGGIGVSKYPGMTYEEGIDAAIRWLTGLSDDHPMED